MHGRLLLILVKQMSDLVQMSHSLNSYTPFNISLVVPHIICYVTPCRELETIADIGLASVRLRAGKILTLPETNMETQKGPYKDYSPSKRGLYGFPG